MDNEGENPVCDLCLKLIHCNFEYVETCTTEMIKMLGMELNFRKIGKPLICKACSANLQKCFEFKTKCLNTEACINTCRSSTNIVNLELKKVYIKKHENKIITPSEYHIVCRLCMEVPKSGHISLHNEPKGMLSVKTILESCFSEIDLNIITNAVVCTSCHASLHSYFGFIKKCSDIADKIKKDYSLPTNRPQEGSNILPSITATLSYKNDYTDIDTCKNFNENELYDGIGSKHEDQELHIKGEVDKIEEVNDSRVEKLISSAVRFTITNMTRGKNNGTNTNIVKAYYKGRPNNETEMKCQDIIRSETSEFNIKHEEIDIKIEDEETARCQDYIPKDTTGEVKHQYTICKFNTVNEHNLKKHLLLHKNVSKTIKHQCEYCDYTAKSKRSLNTHILGHRNDSDISMHQCQLCTYKTILRDRLNKHMLVHKNAYEITMYQCDTCTFQSRYKGVLKRHELSHKHASEVTMYHCESCTYKTKHQSDIKRHILIHKDTSEVVTYQCNLCMYKSKLKCDLRQHMLVHKTPSYLCDTCPYKAKRRARLRQHMLIHKNASEVKMYQCGKCTYKTRHQKVLYQHMAVHKDASEVTTYLCEVCTYRTKRKGNLKHRVDNIPEGTVRKGSSD